ncbi:MAG: GNAT family N-acetyltransferase [Marinobacter sp.]|uniref:GNAT family N-acetyltransferase n=1 Tax=Marinobacter sp. TaxID=50741 RepID=UPI00299D5788|nr:GNAT family N-acetyltransferase [Marinobacter sp.]MDX1634507.1 GNAT family N-acetyltransferase [Marinobacter sp.]
MAITVQRFSEVQFRAMGDAWQACLAESDANRLFMSWPWLYSWWETWSQILGLDLYLLGAFDERNILVGIAPLYRRRSYMPVGLRIDRLQIIGNAWRVSPTVRTEYCGLIFHRDRADDIRRALLQHLAQSGWDELVLCDVSPEEVEANRRVIGDAAGPVTCIRRVTDEGVSIDTTGVFGDWLKTLGKHTRLKVFNRRQYLSGKSDIQFVEAKTSDFGRFFDLLNHFHVYRWGKPAFDREAVLFHNRLLRRLSPGMRAACTFLMVDGREVSVLYDIFAGGVRYNLQSGFQEDLDPKVSLGRLHLGFAIEQAFLDETCAHYDLLAGRGKHSDYKRHFAGRINEFVTAELVRSPHLRLLYREQERLPAGWRRTINRAFRL